MWCVFARWKSLGQCPKSCSQRDAFSDWNSVTEKITDLKAKHWCWQLWTGFKTNGEPRPSPTWVAFCSSTFMNTRGLVVFSRQTNLIPTRTILKITLNPLNNTQNRLKSAQISYFPLKCSLKSELNQLAGRCAELISSAKITHRSRQTMLGAILITLRTFQNTFLKNFVRFWRPGVPNLQWNSNGNPKMTTFWTVLDFPSFIFKFIMHTGTHNLVGWQQKAQKWTYQKE